MSLDVLSSPFIYVYSKSKLILFCIKDGTIRVLFTPKKKVLPYMRGFPEVAIILPHFPTLLLINEFSYASFYILNIFRKTETSKKNHVNSNSKRKISKIKRDEFSVHLDLLQILHIFYIKIISFNKHCT